VEAINAAALVDDGKASQDEDPAVVLPSNQAAVDAIRLLQTFVMPRSEPWAGQLRGLLGTLRREVSLTVQKSLVQKGLGDYFGAKQA
jgi:hypothetical protein